MSGALSKLYLTHVPEGAETIIEFRTKLGKKIYLGSIPSGYRAKRLSSDVSLDWDRKSWSSKSAPNVWNLGRLEYR